MKASPVLRWGVIAIAAIVLCLIQAGFFRQDLINWNGLPLLWRFFSASVHPDLSSDLLQLTLKATIVTLAYAVCGTFFSVIIGAIAGLLCSEVWWSEILKVKQQRLFFLSLRALLAIPRAIHELIWGLFFVNIWGLDPLVAIVAIAIPFSAITAKVFSEILDDTTRKPLQALINSGFPPLSAFLYTLLPQAFLNLLSYMFYRFECSIRSAAVLGIIGAGGLGYEILLSLQSLRYEQLWTFFYALIILNGCVDAGSAWIRNRLGCKSRLDLNSAKPTQPIIHSSRSDFRSPYDRYRFLLNLLAISTAVLSTVIFCFQFINPDLDKIASPRTLGLLGQITRSLFPPNLGDIPQLISLSVDTVSMSVIAIAFSAIGGLLLAFPAAHNFFSPGGLLNSDRNSLLPPILLFAARLILLVCRAIPAPIWALVVLFVVFPGILPGAIALGLHNLGILGRLLAEVIENLEQPPLEALKAQGSPNSLIFLYGVLPPTLPRFLSYTLYRWEVCMRETVIVGLVGAGGLGRSLTEQLSSFDYRSLIVTLGAFLILTFMVDYLSATVRRSLR